MGRFVVHHHAATREHFDLRVEIGAALESFAVPKGPTLDPEQKRLAVHTEPHPLEYLDFEGVIPAGAYGAGPLIVWDQGTVRYHERSAEEGLATGKLDFDLAGFKLRGRFALIATGQRGAARSPNEWLLVKKPDSAATRDSDVTATHPFSVLSGLTVAELSERPQLGARLRERALTIGGRAMPPALDPSAPGFAPMLCASEPVSLDRADFLYELKLDGARLLAVKNGEHITLRYRHGRACTDSFPDVARALRALAPERLVLDGEVTSFDERGTPSFERLAPRLQARTSLALARSIAQVPVTYVVFDVLALEELSLLDVPLHARKALLLELLRGPGRLRALDHLEGNGQPLWELCERHDLEGLVAKRRTSPYRPGRRGPDWVKIKRERDADFVVVGLVGGQGSRERLGALEVASYAGDELVLRGKVGSGLSETLVDALLERLLPLVVRKRPYPAQPPSEPKGRRFVRPELVVTVRHQGWSDEGRLRFPVFREIREDVAPTSCHAAPGDDRETHVVEAAAAALAPDDPEIPNAWLTNPQKVFWPEEGTTKRELMAYYLAVAPALLPLLQGRPALLVRYPDGITGKSFFQWNPPRAASAHVRAMRFRDGEHANKSAFLIDHEASLAYVINLGCIPIHVLAFREGSRDLCDFATIDFDIGDQPFAHAVTLAQTLRVGLAEAGLVGFPKTSGQSGLHVLIPLGPNVPFETARLLVELIGRWLVSRHPDLATMERVVAKRGPRIYVDTGQTGASRAIVAPYSVRAVPGATVSTPLDWRELHAALDPRRFTIRTVPARLAEQGDPMAGLLGQQPDLTAVLPRLERLVRRFIGNADQQ